MKKIIGCLLFLLLLCGVALLLINKRTPDTTDINQSNKLHQENPITQGDKKTITSAEKRLYDSEARIASDKELISSNQLNHEKSQEEEEEQNFGIQLKTDGKAVAKQFQQEIVEDYNWKAHWENEVFVLLSNAGTRFPLQKQETQCRKATCKIKVWASVDRLDYINQTVGGIDDAFTKAQLNLIPNKIDVEQGLLVFYVQPGPID